ncbi:MAG: HNH endonuclease domain-containing protein [Clostridia bacterium]
MDSHRSVQAGQELTEGPVGGGVSKGLPESGQLDIPVMARLFADRTNSYKYFFFLAILDHIDGATAGTMAGLDRPIPLESLAVDMVLAAWYPHGFCRLSLGSQDMLQHAVDGVDWGHVRGSWIGSGSREWQHLRETCARQLDAAALVRYVPYRLIRPFYATETRGLADHLVNERIAELADNTTADHRSPYFFSADRKRIILDPSWLEYLSRNSAILRGWTRFRLAEYLQARNPSIPGIVAKLAPPLVRESLARQTSWWQTALPLIGSQARCIYSGTQLLKDTFTLDHYLPWSFVTHDRQWNLLPVPKAINSAKSDRLPAGKYLTALVTLQHAALSAMHTALPEPRWLNSVEPFMTDLRLDRHSLLNPGKLLRAYEETVTPLETLARRQGFAGGWEY